MADRQRIQIGSIAPGGTVGQGHPDGPAAPQPRDNPPHSAPERPSPEPIQEPESRSRPREEARQQAPVSPPPPVPPEKPLPSTVRYTREEAEFLAPVLEIEERPPHKAITALAVTLLVALTFVALWVYFGRLDVVVAATGKIIPDERTKVVQASAGGAVLRILVSDGDKVTAGQPLFLVDPTLVEASLEQVTERWLASRLAHAMHHLLADAATTDAEEPPDLGDQEDLEDIPPERLRRQSRLLVSTYRAYRAQLDEIAQQVKTLRKRREIELAGITDTEDLLEKSAAQTDSELKTVFDQAAHWRGLLPQAQDELGSFRKLHETQAVSRLQLNDAEEHVAGIEANIDSATNRSEEIKARAATGETQLRQAARRHQDTADEITLLIGELETKRVRMTSDFVQFHEDASVRNQEERDNLALEMVKLERESQSHQIVSPVDGVVQEMAVHTIGAMLQPTQLLLVVVPENPLLQVEASVLNKDIGLVKAGQPVQVKVDTFPYTRFGLADGEILHLSADAVQDELLGLVYLARIALKSDRLEGKAGEVLLSPGMSVTAEIKIGTRRVYEYFLAPLLEVRHESLREP